MFCDSISYIEWCQRKCSNHNCYLIKDEDIVQLKGLNEENDKITERITNIENNRIHLLNRINILCNRIENKKVRIAKEKTWNYLERSS